MEKGGRISMKRDLVEKCLRGLEEMRWRRFIADEDKELASEERERKYRIYADVLYSALKSAMPDAKKGPGHRRNSRRTMNIKFSRTSIFKEAARQLQKWNRGQYQITQHKINSILDEVTMGREAGEFFHRSRESPPRYIYTYEAVEVVIEIIKKNGVSAQYLQKKLNLTQKTYYTFIEDLCKKVLCDKSNHLNDELSINEIQPDKAHDGGCPYIQPNSPVYEYIFAHYELDEKGNIISKDPRDLNSKKTHYRFPLELCDELVSILKAKEAIAIQKKKQREQKRQRNK